MKKILIASYKAVKSVLGGYRIDRFYPIKVAHNFVRKHLRSNFAIVEGHKMFLDSIDSLDLSINGVYEEFQTSIVKEKVKKGDIILDIGANIGYYTLIFAKLVGENGKVYAFEPDPTNFAILKKNVEINEYKNVILIPKAVSNENTKVKLYLSENNKGDHRIFDLHDGRKFVEVESVKLDDYFKDYSGKINFIKMDIQGAEGRAVLGMCDLLNRNKNVKIISEFWPVGLKQFGIEPLEYLKLFLKQGFNIYIINEKQKKIELMTNKILSGEYTPKREINLLCVREQ